MGLGPNAGYIIAAYLISFGVVVGAILLVLADARRVRRRLADLEARGIRRRSGQSPVEGRVAEPRPGTTV